MPTVIEKPTLIEKYEEFSAYRYEDGTVVYLGKDMLPWHRLWDLDTFQELWHQMSIDIYEFRNFAYRVTGENRLLNVCEDCENVHEFGRQIHNRFVCQGCQDENYFTCPWCDDWGLMDDYAVVSDERVCRSCEEYYGRWCEECEEYYHVDHSEDHRHHGCMCDAPAQSFAVRNDGEGPLRNDVETRISLPSGVISEEGINAIRQYLNKQQLWDASVVAADEYNEAPEWQTRRGNFTKRLSRALHKTSGEKLAPEVMSSIGNIAREHSTGVDHIIAVTRDLNLPPEEFAHEESCWWQSYSNSRCALKSNGGFGLRAFENGRVIGRAWVMPLKSENGVLVPTFETLNPDAFFVFNGYGTLSGYTACRIVSHMAGMTYRKISLSMAPMYINGDTGYLVAPEDIAEPFTDGSYSRSLDEHANLYQEELRHKELAHA